MNKELFNKWLTQCLIPELKEGDVVIMDNASFHKSLETRHIIERAGCKLRYLPTYSPDLNPIEKLWARLKKIIRYARRTFDDIISAIDYAFNVVSTRT
jgi:transposase